MTDPKVLAEALFEAGIVNADEVGGSGYQIPGEYYRFVPANYLITEWRVAGKVLESMQWAQLNHLLMPWRTSVSNVDPRTIIEAWYAEQEGDKL